MQWSDQQEAIFGWFETGQGNLVVKARAGTGKTTTILEGARRAPEQQIAIMAFNKRIAEELKGKVINSRGDCVEGRIDDERIEAMTLHSAGMRIVRRYWGNARIGTSREIKDRPWGLAKRACRNRDPDDMVKLVAKLMTYGRECAPFAEEGGDLAELACQFDCVPDPDWQLDGYSPEYICERAVVAMRIALEPTKQIDFADMLYLPVRQGWIQPRFGLVLIDEAQDMNRAQLELAVRLSSGRVGVVGDDRQAIYAFRGADPGALGRMRKHLDAAELPLSTTYRCAKAIVKVAQEIVPDYTAYDANPEGIIREIERHQLIRDMRPQDAVLSRTNAPLVSLCLSALRAGISARIEGRDVAAGIRALIRRLATGQARSSIHAFRMRVDRWQELEEVRLRAMKHGAEEKLDAMRDQAGILLALAEGAASVAALKGNFETLFDDVKSGDATVFSSVHKAKGMEWQRVYVLAWTFGAGKLEEDNLRYVAATRAIGELVMVEKEEP